MNVKILHGPTEEDWLRVKRAAFVTIGKDTDTPPTLEWKKKMIRANHSPVRLLVFDVLLEDIPSWVSVHLVRHVHAQPFVSTQRNDRVKIAEGETYDRRKAPQDTPVDMIWHFNIEELVTICHKRLCALASKETRQVVIHIVNAICEKYPEFPRDIFVPLCVYRGGQCDEFKPCKFYLEHGHGYYSKTHRKDILESLLEEDPGHFYEEVGDEGVEALVDATFRLVPGYGILYEHAKDYVDNMDWGA